MDDRGCFTVIFHRIYLFPVTIVDVPVKPRATNLSVDQQLEIKGSPFHFFLRSHMSIILYSVRLNHRCFIMPVFSNGLSLSIVLALMPSLSFMTICLLSNLQTILRGPLRLGIVIRINHCFKISSFLLLNKDP